MDRTSRFQNPVSLSSGGFSKAPPSQNEGVGTKPIPSLILDRFRAMVKEREEELRVFGGGVGLPLITDEIVRIYEVLLSELTTNLKPIITDLTIIAGEQRAHGEGIADAICARIIEVTVDQKLPSLYLLDSIVKNIGKEYIRYFSVHLPEVFCSAYAQVLPNMHSAMRHLFGTWSSVFPLSVLQKIETQLQFSPSVNGRTSAASKASASPRPLHGIHVNPKYFEVQNKYGNSTADPFGTEQVSPNGRVGLTTTSDLDAVKNPIPPIARIIKSSSPYRVGSLSSPSVEEFSVDDNSPKRTTLRDEETSQWRKRNYLTNPNQQLTKASGAYKYNSSSDIDLRGPRALISAYGMDEREKNLNRNYRTSEQLDTNGGVGQNVSIRTWQNTEEEEFDWQDMTTQGLADRRSSNDVVYSSLSRGSFSTNNGARLVNDYGSNLSQAQLASVANSSIAEDVSNFTNGNERISGLLTNVAGDPNDSTSRFHPSFTQDSLILPHQLSRSHLNTKEGRSSSESQNFITGDQQNPSDMNFGGPSSTFNPTKVWNPTNFHTSHMMSSLPPHMQIRGQFGLKKPYPDQIHSEQYSGSTRIMSQSALSQAPTFRPGSGPLNLQNTAQLPLGQQQNMLMPQDPRQNIHLPSSNAIAPPLSHGYLGQQGLHSSLPILNGPFHAHRPPFHSTNQALPIGQRPPTPSAGPALSGLISSLMAQGLISLTKQDSVGVEFDSDSLKVRHESTITALYSDLPRQCTTCGLRFRTQEEHSKHMDWHVNRNRNLKNRKTKPSPKWFVNATMWLRGAEALGTETAPGFLPAENAVEKEEDEEVAVPADEDQNTCALCGEPFDDFYSDETEEWMYRGAVYMNVPAGATVGMDRSELGPIVHAKCRSDSNGVSPQDVKKNERDWTEEGGQRKRLRSSLS